MDTSNEYAQDKHTPETMAEKVSHVTELISAQFDDDQAADQAHGEQVPGDDVRTDDSGAGAVDTSPVEPAEGVEDDPQEGESETAEGTGDDITLRKLAEHLELEPADLYELEVPIGEGLTSTLGELKDEYKQYGPAKEYQAELDRQRADFERQTLATRSELNAIMSIIPDNMKQQVIQQARQYQGDWEKKQDTAVLEAIPDWADADKRANDRAHIIEDGAEYGFSEQEMTHTQDARTLRWMRDFARMKRELNDMRAAAKTQPGRANPPGKAGAQSNKPRKLAALLNRGKSDPTMQGKASVVSQLIRNQ